MRLTAAALALAAMAGSAGPAAGTSPDPRSYVPVRSDAGRSAILVPTDQPLGRSLTAAPSETLTIRTNIEARRIRVWVNTRSGRRVVQPVSAERAGSSGRAWRYELSPRLRNATYALRTDITYVKGKTKRLRYHLSLIVR